MMADSNSFNRTLNNHTSTTGADSTTDVPDPVISASSQPSNSNKTGVIVGVVVGVVGALTLASAIIWYIRRRASRRHNQGFSKESSALASEPSTGDRESPSPSHSATALGRRSPPSPPAGVEGTPPIVRDAPRRRRVVQEQDAVYGQGYAAPPSYRGDWTSEFREPIDGPPQTDNHSQRSGLNGLLSPPLTHPDARPTADDGHPLPPLSQEVQPRLTEEYKRAFTADPRPTRFLDEKHHSLGST